MVTGVTTPIGTHYTKGLTNGSITNNDILEQTESGILQNDSEWGAQ